MSSRSIIIAIFILSVCIAIIPAQQNAGGSIHSPPCGLSNGVCLSPQCIHAVSRILLNVKSEVNPCEDFYEHVCGNYAKTSTIPDDLPLISPMINGVQREIPLRLQRIIEDIDESRAPSPFSDIKIFYETCVESEWNNSRDSTVDSSRRSFIADTWKNIFTLRDEESQLAEYFFQIHYVFSYDKILNSNNPKEQIFQLTIAPGFIPWNYLKEGLTNQVVQKYLTFMKFVITDLGAEHTRIDTDLMDILNFEIKLAQIVSPDNDDFLIYKSPIETTIGTLQTDYPNIRFKNKGFNMSDTSVVQVFEDLKILANLNELISRTSKWVLASWALWRRTVDKSVLNRLGQDIHHEYETLLYHSRDGTVRNEGTRKNCALSAYSDFPFVLEALYYGQYMSKKAWDDSGIIFGFIREEFTKSVNEADWLTHDTRVYAANKVGWIRRFAGHEEYMLDEESNPGFVDFKLSDGILAENRANLTKIKEHSNDKLYPFTRTVASYLFDNRIILGAVMFTEALFDINRPAALNYGAIGRTIGHEMAHSLGHDVKWFNRTGRIPQASSWDPQSLDNYAARTRCLEDQHKKYAFDKFGLNVTASRTLVEDIADLMGVKAAYVAYKKHYSFDLPLPGLHYTPRQLFWISSAAYRCTKRRSLNAIHNTYKDPHSLEESRVNVPLSNLQEFSDDFQCEANSKMNPVNKCTFF